jgi:hypothetical protein
VNRINAVIDLLRDEVKGKSKASRKEVNKMCQSFHEYVHFSVYAPPGAQVRRMIDWRDRDLENLLKDVKEEEKKDKTYLKRFLKSPSIRDHIAGFKQKLDDARSNLTVRTPFYLIFLYSLTLKGELTL